MKKSIKVALGFSIFLLFITINSFAQIINEHTTFGINRQITLENSSDNQDVKIKISVKECRLNLRITSEVEAGEVEIELYDQDGKKQGNYSVGCQSDTHSANERVDGTIRKSIDNPELGDWVVKILPQKASGIVRIQYTQETKSNK